MDDLDALLADLETTTSLISKHPVLLTDPPGPRNLDPAMLGRQTHSNGISRDALEPRPPPPAYTPQQTVLSAATVGFPGQQPLKSGDKEHLYSTVCKPKSPKVKEQPTFSSSSVLGGGLCELDRLLQELNATQFNITDEIMSQFPNEKGKEVVKTKEPPAAASAKLSAGPTSRGMESMPVSESSMRGEEVTPRAAQDGSAGGRAVPQTPARPSATSATLELDKLMASLSDFKVQSNIPPYQAAPPPVKVPASQPVVSKPPPPPAGGNLDNMLVMLQSDLSRQGISTVAKGVCAACQKPIAGQVVSALDQTWHPEHFVCAHCQREMGGSNFFEKDGLPYCERDYFQLFSPRCGLCNEPILDKMVTALDQNWHPEHFCCVKCRRPFGEEGFHEKDGKQYCRQDFYEMFATRCKGCTSAILENYISALNALWHPECFVCRECYTPFVNGSFFEHEGQPYCEIHYHKHRGSLCSGCEKPITGRCITAMGKKFHPEHFVCAFCLKQLNKGTFKEQNEKPYCHGCFIKLFG
ncbi:transforming growth factor beta-1-induced transcript 1 protein isoform X1 [Latimeria chalumnae]|uniref:transforming growth factor beta-1-induced transcript 1 protein isoform X1 n=1 Tax=Latimeria chalumnae TaxID=7897 RepID=UPI00313C6F60